MIKNLLLLFLFLLLLNSASGQKEDNTWYFGRNAGLDFSGDTPLPLHNGQINTYEGCSTISDGAGNLLFYTDGMKVWNRTHMLMKNGTGLAGHPSSTQSGLIIKKPGSETLYYVFSIDTKDYWFEVGSFALRYSVVDLSVENGLGEVINKNVLLHAESCEKLAALPVPRPGAPVSVRPPVTTPVPSNGVPSGFTSRCRRTLPRPPGLRPSALTRKSDGESEVPRREISAVSSPRAWRGRRGSPMPSLP